MRLIGIEGKDQAAGEFILESLQRAVDADRVTLEDIALAMKGADGKVKIHQTKGSIVGHFHDRGVSDKLMKNVTETLEPGQTMVFALGSDEMIQAIDERVQELSDGEFATFNVDQESPDALQEITAQLARKSDR
jgi:uncharacterized membrane protein